MKNRFVKNLPFVFTKPLCKQPTLMACLGLIMVTLLPPCATAKSEGSPSDTAYLVKDGKIQGHLFLPRKYGRPVMLAEEELREYFRKMTGDELRLSYRDPDIKHQRDTGIHLVVRKPEEWQGKESAQAFVIEETPKPNAEIPITGVTITGNTEMAVLYGVYQYLGQLGVRWFSPGEIGENVPERKEIALSARREVSSPSFLERCLDLSGTAADHFSASDPIRYRDEIHHDYALWRLRNRLMFERSINRGNWFDFNGVVTAGSHGLRRIVLDGVDFSKEPERFPMLETKAERDWAAVEQANHPDQTQPAPILTKKERQEKGGQICFTNKANVEAAIQSAVDYFERQEANPTDLDEVMDTFPMGLSDATGICECEACTKAAGKGPYSRDRLIWSFYNRVAKGLGERMPGKKIGLFAPYFELSRPPEDIKIEPNIVAVSVRAVTWSALPEDKASYPFAKDHLENMRATGAAGAELRMATYTAWMGSPQILSLLDAAEAYHDLGIRYFHVEVMNRNEQLWPVLWTLAQYAWDANQSTAGLLERYCREYYGKGGKVVLDLMKQLDANAQKLPRIIFGGYATTQMIMTDDLVSQGERDLEVAIGKAKGKEKTRLELFRDTFAMFASTAKAYRAYCDALNTRTPEAIQQYQQAVADSEKLWVDKNLARTCSPRVLAKLKEIGEVAPEPKSFSRPELADDATWRRELFSLDAMPETLPNLFPLPEMWKFRIDPRDIGLAEGWEKPDYNDQSWRTISTWNAFEPQGNKALDGRFWYRLKFKAPVFPDGKKILLRFGSLDDDGDIYINGELAWSRHLEKGDDWKASFVFDATRFIRPGQENIIAVRGFDSGGGGGIWQPSALYTD